MADIKMPQLGESVTEGTIGRWLKKPGDFVEKYEPICEVETDKVNAEVPASFAGTMLEILVEEGTTVAVGHLICRIQPADAADAGEETTSTSAPAAVDADVADVEIGDTGMKARYSPAVLRLAQDNNIDLTLVRGTGQGGRITRKDVLKAMETGTAKAGTATAVAPAKPVPTVAPSAPAVEKVIAPVAPKPVSGTALENGDVRVPLTSVRRTIAQRMVQSKHEAPHAWTMMEVDVTGLVELRNRHKDEFKAREGVSLTFMPFFIKAVVDSLKEFPYVNAVWGGDHIVLKKGVHISVAVATDDALYVPVIHDADDKSLVGLAKSVNTLVKKTRAGKLDMNDLTGGTFTVNNTGSFGSIASVPIINSPQAAILSFEAIVKRPVVINNMIAVRDMMNLCMSLDHRVLDGLMAGNFLKRVKERLESYSADTQL